MKYLKNIPVWALFVCLLAITGLKADAQEVRKNSKAGFIENQGQWSNDFSYVSHNGNVTTWITQSGLTFDVRGENIKTGRKIIMPSKFRSMNDELVDEEIVKHHAVHVQFDGASIPSFEPAIRQEGSSNYFYGSDQTKWRRDVPHYESVVMKDLYAGVDALVTNVDGSTQYNFIVAPGYAPSQIKLRLEGADDVWTNPQGELVIKTSCGELHNGTILAYQMINGHKTVVPCSYKVQQSIVQFQLGSYDRSQQLVIDPIVYATYLGGDDADAITSSARYSNGDVVVVGYTTSSNFPKTAGSYTSAATGAEDVFVSRYDAKLTKAVFTTFLGGATTDKAWDVTISRDASNDFIFVVGETASSNFPTVSGSFKQNTLGGVDAFAFKLTSKGDDLNYSTYYGGGADDRAYSCVVTLNNELMFCGETNSTNLLISTGAHRTTSYGQGDGFVARLGSTGGLLSLGTYYGGGLRDRCLGISNSVSKDKFAFITGETKSSDLQLFPQVFVDPPGPNNSYYDPVPPQKKLNATGSGAGSDAFIASYDDVGKSLLTSTYLGGNGDDYGNAIIVDNAGVTTIVGGTTSTNLTLLKNYQPTKKAGVEVLLGGVTSDGKAFGLTAYLGGSGDDVAYDIEADDFSDIYIVGKTMSTDFPVTTDAQQPTYGTNGDGFIVKLNGYVDLKYGSYIGGNGVDEMRTVTAIDASNAYVGGFTSTGTLPTSAGAVQKASGGKQDGYFAKFTFSSLTISTPVSTDKKCAGQPLSISWFASNPETTDKYTVEYSSDGGTDWNLIKKDVTATTATWSTPLTLVGGSDYRIRVTNQSSGYSVLNPGKFTILAAPNVSSTSPDTSLCIGQPIAMAVTAVGDGITYQWRKGGTPIPGATASTYSIATTTMADSAKYDVVVSGVCSPAKTSALIWLKVLRGVTILQQPKDVTVNAGKAARFEVTADGKNLSYRWQRDGVSIPGATNSFYEFFAQNQDKGSYRCLISGDCGSDTTASAKLDISASIAEEAEADGSLRIVSLVPNPVSTNARLTISTVAASTLEYIVMNEIGQVVLKASSESHSLNSFGNYEHSIDLNTSLMAQGSYKIMAVSGSKRVYKSFVVQR